MKEIDYSEVIRLKYPQYTHVGVLYTTGRKASYSETYHGKNVYCADIKSYYIFDTRELFWDWLMENKEN